MKFDALLDVLGNELWFDFNTVSLFFPLERPETLKTALYRFVKDARLISLRKGFYEFGPRYRKTQVSSAKIANILYAPSYLSERWALGWYGIIPEKVVQFTSVSPRATKTFKNDRGTFSYRMLKQDCFFGYTEQNTMGTQVLIAEPEKALLDLWYLAKGEWTTSRMESMRFNPEMVNLSRLCAHASIFKEKRMLRAVEQWQLYSANLNEGTIVV